MKGGIASRFAVLISLVVLVATATVGFMVYRGAQDSLMQAATDRVAHTTETIKVRIDATLDGIGRDVRFLSATPPVQGIVRARLRYGLDPETSIRDDEWGEQLAEIFRAFLENRSAYLQARLIGRADGGRELVRVDRQGGDAVFADPQSFQGRSEEGFFRQAIQLPEGDVYLSEVGTEDTDGLPRDTPILHVATPIYSEEGVLFGVITVSVDFGAVLAPMEPLVDSTKTLHVANGRGDYLLAPDRSAAPGGEAARYTTLQRAFPQAAALVQGTALEFHVLDAALGGGKRGIAYFERLPFDRQAAASGLLVGVTEPHETILAGVRAVRNESALITLLLCLSALGLALSVSGYLTRPLRRITRAVDSFGERGETVPLPVRRGDEIGLLARAFEAMSQQIQDQIHELEDEERRQRAILETAAEGIIVTDAEGAVETFNPAAETIFGYAGDDVAARPVGTLIRLHGNGAEAAGDGAGETGWLSLRPGDETVGRRADGREVPLFLTWSTFQWGGEGKYTIFVQDITDRKEAETARERLVRELEAERARLEQLSATLEERVRERTAELVRTNRELETSNRELREFADVASHDLQEPLRKLRSFASLLQSEYGAGLPEDGQLYIQRIYSAAERMSRLIADLIAFSHVTDPARAFREVDLSALAREAAADLHAEIAEAGAEVHVDALPAVEGDPEQLHQLLRQLLANAVEHRRPGVAPVVRVRASKQRVDDGAGDGAWVCRLEVEDNGVGFDEKYADRIFSPFERLQGRRAEGGTGMGLTICRRIAGNHGGSITVRSTPGEGSTFVVALPLRQRKQG